MALNNCLVHKKLYGLRDLVSELDRPGSPLFADPLDGSLPGEKIHQNFLINRVKIPHTGDTNSLHRCG